MALHVWEWVLLSIGCVLIVAVLIAIIYRWITVVRRRKQRRKLKRQKDETAEQATTKSRPDRLLPTSKSEPASITDQLDDTLTLIDDSKSIVIENTKKPKEFTIGVKPEDCSRTISSLGDTYFRSHRRAPHPIRRRKRSRYVSSRTKRVLIFAATHTGKVSPVESILAGSSPAIARDRSFVVPTRCASTIGQSGYHTLRSTPSVR